MSKLSGLVAVVLFVGLMAGLCSADLVAYWNFNGAPDPGDANTVMILPDLVGDADGGLCNGAEYVVSEAGISGYGLGWAGSFDDIDDEGTISCPPPVSLDLGTSDFTVTGWFKAGSVSGEDFSHYILDNSVHNGGGLTVWLGPDNKSYRGKLIISIKGEGADNIDVMSDVRLDDDVWHWFGAVSSSGTVYLYVDGALQVGSAAYGAMTTATPPATVCTTIGEKLGGQVDELRVYNEALSVVRTGSVLTDGDLYAAWQYPQGLVNYWDFNSDTGIKIAYDGAGLSDVEMVAGADFIMSLAGQTGAGMGNAGIFGNDDDFAAIGFPYADGFGMGRGDFTVTGWIKADATNDEAYYHMILQAGQHNLSGVNIWLARGDRSYRGKLGIDIKGTEQNITVMSDTRLDDNQWHWFAAVISSQVIDLYVDGMKQIESGFPYGATTNATTPISLEPYVGYLLDGQIDDLRIYHGALSVVLDGSDLIGGDLYDVWQVPALNTCADVAAAGLLLEGDLTEDCVIDLADFARIAANWLRCNDPEVGGCETPGM